MPKFTTPLILLAIFIFLSNSSYCQTGDEWIVDGQEYFKIPIGEEGIYKIEYSNLTALGTAIDNVDPRNFQLFRNGEEQYLYVRGEQDGSFDQGDVIEFYGQKNDGTLESALYKSASDQPHKDYSIFTDTSSYYLTWSTSPSSKRFSAYYDNNYTVKISNTSFMHSTTQIYTSDYFAGVPLNNDGGQLYSEYTGGEGFHKWVWSSQGQFNLTLPAINTSGPNATIEAIAYSGNHNTSQIVNNYNHEFGLSVNSRANIIARQKTLGYERIDISADIVVSELNPTTTIYMGEITFGGSGFNVSRLKITYPRLFDLENNSELHVNSNFTSSFFDFSNYPDMKSAPVVYDLSSKKRIKADKQTDNHIFFNLPNSGKIEYLIQDETEIKQIGSIERVEMVTYTPDPLVDYLIITNKKLEAGAIEYKNYRESTAGGSYTVEIVYVQDLYEKNGYGIESPLAVRNFIETFGQLLPNLKNILILGKGQLYSRIRSNDARKNAYNLVPAIGLPASDYLYVSPLNSTRLNIDYGIGRIPARSNDQIEHYLEKLKAFESQPNADWQKKVIQLAGGNGDENETFKGYLNSYYNVIKQRSLGGYRVLFSKSEPVPVQTSLTGRIQEEINKGACLLSYFGHGAAQVTEISLGEPDQLNNFGKTPLFLFNGCALGNTYEDLSLAEKFLFEPNNGALGWVASSTYGFTQPLFVHTLEIHKALFNTTYGEGIGQAMKKASENYGSPSQPISILEARQLIYHGDPVLDIFTPEKPDYFVSSGKINEHIAASDSIEIVLDVKNLGISDASLLTISINASNSQSGTLASKKLTITGPSYKETYAIRLPNRELKGFINFNITLDSANSISELLPLGESNNTFSLQHLIKQKSPSILIPIEDAIVSDANVNLTIQIPGYAGIARNILLEWDSLPYFGNPVGTKSINSSKTLLKETISIPSFENKDYYIRSRFIENGIESDWAYRTFGYLKNDLPGWTEGNKWKFYNTTKNFINVDSANGNFEFQRTNSVDYQISTYGQDAGKYANRWIIVDGYPALINWWPFTGSVFMIINPDTDERYSEDNNTFNVVYPSPWWTPPLSKHTVVGNKSGVYHYNTDVAANQDSMISLLRRVPHGYHIVMMSTYTSKTELWSTDLWNELEKFGILQLQSIKNGEPFGIYGTKGSSPGSATEYLGDYASTVTPPREQLLAVSSSFTPRVTRGSISSKVIGPSNGWEKLTIYMDSSSITSTDSFTITLLGSKNGNDWQNIDNIHINKISINLSHIDANTFPFLRFKIDIIDLDKRTALNIKRWKINYKEVSEGTVHFDDKYTFKSDTLAQGEPLKFSISFTNIKDNTFDSSNYLLSLRNNSTGITDTLKWTALDSIQANSNVLIKDTIETNNISGDYQLLLSVNSNKQVNEHNYENNYFSKNFIITKDNKNPLLDVVFDGKHILNNDIVSPNTSILMTANDDNPHLALSDPSTIWATLVKPNGQTDTINTSLTNVLFTPASKPQEEATLTYNTNELPSGDYILKAKVRDASGNLSSNDGYQIQFKVIREASISNIYPYPNPFSTQMKFVYTLTGSKVPDYMKIQILTVTGKVVREISQYELGSIRIGNNISEFTWDGTDEYGDPLANGVYLYKVTAKIDGENIAHRDTEGDQFFQNGIGKIYLGR
tara:strand:- start:4002 stop:8951 length:4950 start_codon:yes stop_codon:yes gene_type:complete